MAYSLNVDVVVLFQVFVSPYGHGEFSLKDYEIMMAGCVVVKPQAADYVSYPNFYVPGETVFSVNANFSDLGTVLLDILQNLGHAQKMVTRTHELLQQYSRPEQFARDFDSFMSNVVV